MANSNFIQFYSSVICRNDVISLPSFESKSDSEHSFIERKRQLKRWIEEGEEREREKEKDEKRKGERKIEKFLIKTIKLKIAWFETGA